MFMWNVYSNVNTMWGWDVVQRNSWSGILYLVLVKWALYYEVKVSIYMFMWNVLVCKHKVGVFIKGMRRTYKAIRRVESRAGYMGPVLWGSESCLFSLYHLMEWKSPQLAWFTAHLNRREPWQEAKALVGLSRGRARTAGRVVTGLSYRAAGRSWGWEKKGCWKSCHGVEIYRPASRDVTLDNGCHGLSKSC